MQKKRFMGSTVGRLYETGYIVEQTKVDVSGMSGSEG